MINQYGRIKVDLATELQELKALGFSSANFETLLRQALPSYTLFQLKMIGCGCIWQRLNKTFIVFSNKN